MKVLFVYTSIGVAHEDSYAFGFATLVSMAKRAGYVASVKIIDTLEQAKDLMQFIELNQPRVVAFTSVSSQFHYVKMISAQIKYQNPSIITVCGGVHTTIFPESVMKAPGLDAIFIGESEDAFVEFLNKVQCKEPYRNINNLAYNDHGKLVINPLNPLIENLDRIPFPDKTTYPYEKEASMYGVAPFMFSRGCPYSCSYCSNHAIAQRYGTLTNKPRYRSPELCIQEIEETLKMFPYIKKIIIKDDIFGLDKKWAYEFLKLYKEKIPIPFACLLRANVVSDDFIKALKDSGCYRISFGIESGNDYIRNMVMNRNMSKEQIIEAFALCKKYRLEANAINIIGFHSETEDMIWDTINLNRLVKPTTSGVNIFYPYKGTLLGDFCFSENLVNMDLYNSFSNERLETVLKFPEDHKNKLKNFHTNWTVFVYPFDIKTRMKLVLMKNKNLWAFLRRVAKALREM